MTFEFDLGDTVFKQQVRMYWRGAKDSWVDDSGEKDAIEYVLKKLYTSKFNNSAVEKDEVAIVEKLKIEGPEESGEGFNIKRSPFVCIGETPTKELILMTLVSQKIEGKPFANLYFKIAIPVCAPNPIEANTERGKLKTHFALLCIDNYTFGPFIEDLLSLDNLSNHPVRSMWETYLKVVRDTAGVLVRDFHDRFSEDEKSKKWWM